MSDIQRAVLKLAYLFQCEDDIFLFLDGVLHFGDQPALLVQLLLLVLHLCVQTGALGLKLQPGQNS